MEFFIMELKFKYCKLCGNEYKRVCDLSYHVQHVHDISPKEYYDRYLKEDRDIHAAKNVKFIGTIKRAECLEQASVETLPSTVKPAMVNGKTGRRSEKEGSTF